ncbi:Hsp20/alpha crystallin family protein [Streptomyces naphthomycinicus]|uniref:Hsp20/alpha crystallin family protein n=1 Tax=Streptomyces naphthomycinicus TaxID=2872625 RepID=UPI0027E4B74F|nr:Hsp20/alpha crystallin family protein [Streptomyces sp. TML10]
MWRRSTRRVGAFDHRLRLPGELDAHEIKAEMQDGVLSITVPQGRRRKAATRRDHRGE